MPDHTFLIWQVLDHTFLMRQVPDHTFLIWQVLDPGFKRAARLAAEEDFEMLRARMEAAGGDYEARLD